MTAILANNDGSSVVRLSEIEEYLAIEREHCCKHGHFFCSDIEGGDCIDEYLSVRGLDNYGEPIAKED